MDLRFHIYIETLNLPLWSHSVLADQICLEVSSNNIIH